MVHRFKREIERGRFVDVAAASAMWLFLSLLPIAAVLGMIVAKIQIANKEVASALFAFFPPDSRRLLEDELGRVAVWNGGAVGPISAIVFLWLASSGVQALFDSFEVISGVTRSWLRKRAIAIGVCVVLSIMIAAMGAVIGVASPFFQLEGYVVAFAVELALIVVLFAAGIPRRGKPRRLFPGALFAASLHAVLALGYVRWIRRMGDGGAYLAGLATVGVTMIALWLFAFSLLLGLTLNKILSERAEIRDRRDAESRSTFRSAGWHLR